MLKNSKDVLQSSGNGEDSQGQTKKHYLKTVITLSLAIFAFFFIWFADPSFFHLKGLTVIQQRAMAIFVFATIMWLFEVIPAWSTSILIIVLMLLTLSNSSFKFLLNENSIHPLGKVLNYKDILATFADPICMLFIGGFVLAIAATKSGLDAMIAKNLIKPFGSKPENVLLGFILITGIFSMFISNTATAAMMLTFLAPIFRSLPKNGKGGIALALSIPVAANIGGMGTPIGTPPNAIALKYLNDPAGLNMNIGFGEWMSFMFPFTILMLVIAWVILKTLFPFKERTIRIEIKHENKKTWRNTLTYITFAITILLWMLDKVTGINSNVVAMIPIAVFCATGIITKDDLAKINWSVIWMVAGGFALGLALNKTGLADITVESIPFAKWSPVVVLIISGLICWILSNFISNTATAALLVPILVIVCSGLCESLHKIGGTATLLIGIAISASCAMCLPISTPPNAIAHSTGLVKQNDMLKVGIVVGIITMGIGFTMLYILGTGGFFE